MKEGDKIKLWVVNSEVWDMESFVFQKAFGPHPREQEGFFIVLNLGITPKDLTLLDLPKGGLREGAFCFTIICIM